MSAVRTETQTKHVSGKSTLRQVNLVLKDQNKTSQTNELCKSESQPDYKMEIVWLNVIAFFFLYVATIYGFYLHFTRAKLLTIVSTWTLGYLSSLGILMGAHRLFTHRSFEATKYLQIALIVLHTICGQNCLWIWVRDHRQHHKFSETDADPHNSTRGFFFAHVGWLMVRKHPAVIEKGKTIDMSDMDANPYVMFQKRHYKKLFFLLGVVIPIAIPCLLWGESVWVAFIVCFAQRLGVGLNTTWLVNSAAHIYGTRPFSKDIKPVENALVSFFTLGEGWHNYHHTFPWDYRAAEFGQRFNVTTSVINYCVVKGWAYNVKYAKPQLVMQQATKHGDGSHPVYGTRCPDL